jgi:cytochrome c oxidase assembly protein subunit 15
MVRSGLQKDPSTTKEIRVSPYRLAAHLAMAFATYTGLVYTALELLYPRERMQALLQKMSKDALQKIVRLRSLTMATAALVGFTALSGAFVAGNDAGRAFNTFPTMNGRWMPEGLYKDLSPRWRNLFEHTPTVQFDHRMLAYSTLTAICGLHAWARSTSVSSSTLWAMLPAQSRVALNVLLGAGLAQAGLGITTLLLYVPVPLAVAHQTGALVLLTVATFAAHSLKYARVCVNAAPRAGGVGFHASRVLSAIRR